MSNSFATRLVAVRKSLGMTQDAFCTHTGLPLSTLKNYEGEHRKPGAEAMEMLARVDINVNWLFTGKGEMLTTSGTPEIAAPVKAQINEDALVAAFVGMMQVAAPGETPKQTATKAIQFYKYLLDQEMITTDGIGKGRMGNAA